MRNADAGRWGIHWTNKGPIRTPFHYNSDGSKNWNATHLFDVNLPTAVESNGRRLRSFQLPIPNKRNCLHVFAASYTPAQVPSQPGLETKVQVSSAWATRRWDTVDGRRGQVIEVTLTNPLSVTHHGDPDSWAAHVISARVSGSGFTTIRPGRLARLMPGDKMMIEVLVAPSDPTADFTDAHIELASGNQVWNTALHVEGSKIVQDWTKWTDEVEDLEQHSSPSWFADAKFGVSCFLLVNALNSLTSSDLHTLGPFLRTCVDG